MITANIKYTQEVTLVTEICCNCGVAFALPSDLQRVLRADANKYFYCPNGHQQHYSKSTEAILKEKLEAEKVKNEREQNRIWDMVLDERNEKDKLKKQLKRVHRGVCPCCNRSFENLQRHISTKHPDLLPKAVEAKGGNK